MPRTYRAFLSYAHRDARMARRIHADLEKWRIGGDLAGRETPLGPVPHTLRPIFRDREDFAGGGTLTEATREALSASKFLVVFCSPAAAQSRFVNEEIRLFKAMGRADRIIPVIIAGEPGDPQNDCFPRALTHEVAADGELLNTRIEPLAADARDKGDGYRRALAKVVAGLLGVAFDEIARRAERAQRRRVQVLVAVAASMCLLAVAAAGFAWLSEKRRSVAERNYRAALGAADSLLGDIAEELTGVEGIQLETMQNIIDRATSILDELSASLPDAYELKVSKIMALGVFAKALDAKGDSTGALEREHEAEALAEALAAARSNDDDSLRLLAMVRWRLGATLQNLGETEAAIEKLKAAVATLEMKPGLFADQPNRQSELATATLLLSTSLTIAGRLDEAAVYGARAIELAEDLQAGDPDNFKNRMQLASAQIGQAMRLRQQGDKAAALAIYMDAERLLLKELEARPDLPQLRTLLYPVQWGLALAYEDLGDAAAAEAARQRSVATMQHMVKVDAENRYARRERAAYLAEKAEAQARQGSVAEAAALFRESLETLEAMAAETPDDPNVRSSLVLALQRAALALNKGRLYEPAAEAARRLLALREARQSEVPDSPMVIASVSTAVYLLAVAEEGRGNLEAALALRRRQLQLLERLAAGGEDNRAIQAKVHMQIGLLAWRLSRRAEAIPHYERHNALQRELAAASPENASIRIALGEGLLNLGELRTVTGDGPGALVAFSECLAVRRTLVDAGHDEPDRLTDLAWAEARLAQFGDAPTARWRMVESLLTRADAVTPLGDWEEELLTVARIALSGARR